MTIPAVLSVEDVEQIVSDVFESFLGEQLLQPAGAPTTGDPGVQASVSITGEWDGHVVLGCTPSLARSAAGLLLDLPGDELAETDIADAVGELANMIGGNIKGLLPGPNALTLPVVAMGNATMRLPASEEALHLDMTWNSEPLRISVWNGSPEGQDRTNP